jgi:nucleoside-diphosphate-sugar epimerase
MNFWRGKRVMITGGAGMIGSHATEQLVDLGAVITVIDNLKRGNLDNLKAVSGKIDFIEEDLREMDVCVRVCQGKDIVLHLASDAYGISYSSTHHSEILTNNVLLNTNVLEACRRENIKRVLVVSSSCVYPDNSPTPTKDTEELTGEPERANIGYGWSKRLLEIQATHFSKDHNMEIAIVRPANVYGPRDPISGKGTHVIPSLISKVLFEEGPVTVWGSGNQARDFIHSRDAAKAMIHLTENYACAIPVNIGSSKPVTMKELMGIILNYTGIRKSVVFDQTKPEGAKIKCVDTTTLEKTGFKPEISFETGIKETIDFYLKKHIV